VTVMIGSTRTRGRTRRSRLTPASGALSELRLRSGPKQLDRLLRWAERFSEGTSTVENATGLGYLLAHFRDGVNDDERVPPAPWSRPHEELLAALNLLVGRSDVGAFDTGSLLRGRRA
jgi:hypothetical protein